ncbi:hypothetical protein HELRODRAFT_193027, partial [Helobdella robusta]|uniref:Uncharacterized protein n=1 Tax=Helobdella robusta TaxID=6412 RepID=T1FUJ4_HELRO
MSGTLNTSTTFWFNKSVKENVHPVNSVFLTDGRDLKNRPIIMLENIPKPKVGLIANYSNIAYWIQDYMAYLISLIPFDKLKNGVSLIVDATYFKSADVEILKELLNTYKNPGNCMLYVYCICNFQSNGPIDQNTFNVISPGVQVFLISSIAQLMIRVPSSQLHTIYGGTLQFNHPAWKRFMETFEALEAYITKYLNRSMMFREVADVILKRKVASELAHIHPTLNYMNNVTVLQQCERVLNKFRNPDNFYGLKEIQNNPAFELARKKLEFYIAVLMNSHNYYVHNIKYIEDFFDITSSPKKKRKPTNENTSLIQENINDEVKNLFTLSNLKIVLSEKSENIKFANEPALTRDTTKSYTGDGLHAAEPSNIKEIALPSLLQHVLSAPNSDYKNPKEDETPKLAQQLTKLLLSSQSKLKNEHIELNVKKDDDEDELFAKPKPLPRRFICLSVERETQTLDDERRRSVIIQTDLQTNPQTELQTKPRNDLQTKPQTDPQTNPRTDLQTNPRTDLQTNSQTDRQTNLPAILTENSTGVSSDIKLTPQFYSDLKKVQNWYLRGLAMFDEKFIADINNATPEQMTNDIHQTKCGDFLLDNKLDEASIKNIQNSDGSDASDERLKMDLPILIYRK